MAIGAQLTAIVRMVTIDVFLMVLAGAAAGLTSSLVLARDYGGAVFTKLNLRTWQFRFPWLAL